MAWLEVRWGCGRWGTLTGEQRTSAYGSGAELLDSWPQWPQNIKMAIMGETKAQGQISGPTVVTATHKVIICSLSPQPVFFLDSPYIATVPLKTCDLSISCTKRKASLPTGVPSFQRARAVAKGLALVQCMSHETGLEECEGKTHWCTGLAAATGDVPRRVWGSKPSKISVALGSGLITGK